MTQEAHDSGVNWLSPTHDKCLSTRRTPRVQARAPADSLEAVKCPSTKGRLDTKLTSSKCLEHGFTRGAKCLVSCPDLNEVPIYEGHLLARNLPPVSAQTILSGAVKCILRLKMHYKSTDREGAGLDLHRASRHVWSFSQVETRSELSVHVFGDDSTCVTEGDG